MILIHRSLSWLLLGASLLVVALLPAPVSAADTTLLKVGTPAPAFDLPATGKRQVKLSQYKGKNLIIIFYPMDETPGCTVQLCSLRDHLKQYRALNTEAIASNPADMTSHENFAKKESYPFPILVDAKKTMARSYGVWISGSIARTVYIVDGKGIIRFAERGLVPHEKLEAALKKLH